MDVWIYFRQRERECDEMSCSSANLVFAEEEGSEGRRGKIAGHVHLDPDVYLEVSESVEVVGNHVRRTDYAYFLVVDGVEYWGFERDPSHEPPVHGHGWDHEHVPARPIPFKRVLERAWREVSLRNNP